MWASYTFVIGIVVCPLPHNRLYRGVLFLVEKHVQLFRLTLTTSADVVSLMEASLSESLDGRCCSG
jgi:hypothetical protein